MDALPLELQLAIVENLALNDVKALSTVNRHIYPACLPSMFSGIKIADSGQLVAFTSPGNFPQAYYRYIRQLNVGIAGPVGSLVTILQKATALSRLVIRAQGCFDHAVIPAFAQTASLRHLTVVNEADEVTAPLSERLVVAIAASVPELHTLHLERISRSVLTAHDLVGKYPFVPLVTGDSDIPDHPRLGSALNLPSLLSIASLRHLTIRDSHLGDAMWTQAPVLCKLEMLDVGPCVHEPPTSNSLAIERIMSVVGPSLSSFSLPTALASPPPKPLPHLRSLHISPFVAPDEVVETVTALAASPIESLSVQCFADDLPDACGALETFLALRADRGPAFFGKLARIDVDVVGESEALEHEHEKAAQKLQAFCRNLHLMSDVPRKLKSKSRGAGDRLRSNSCAF
uniref:F-box domain-containing protein n=1 Tax=Mycena chlorophos TaxID=658473 RepID=A0ABQ0KW65_MYCCL|nr:predicted protein [Mycena chlorophos]